MEWVQTDEICDGDIIRFWHDGKRVTGRIIIRFKKDDWIVQPLQIEYNIAEFEPERLFFDIGQDRLSKTTKCYTIKIEDTDDEN